MDTNSSEVMKLIMTAPFQLVVEMRTQEIHRLREEQAKHLEQLEELDRTKSELAKMQAKVEDLQLQLERKRAAER